MEVRELNFISMVFIGFIIWVLIRIKVMCMESILGTVFAQDLGSSKIKSTPTMQNSFNAIRPLCKKLESIKFLSGYSRDDRQVTLGHIRRLLTTIKSSNSLFYLWSMILLIVDQLMVRIWLSKELGSH